MNSRRGSWLLIFFLTCSIFSGMFITVPNNDIGVIADSAVWENEYGRLEVEPATSTNIIRQRQWYNLTWYYPDNTVDIAFGFNDSLSYGQIFYWDGDSYNKVSTGHTTYGGQHYYTISNIGVVEDNTIHGYWEYDTPVNSSGKWDMYAKLSSDSWSTAFSTGRIIHLDPWWDSDWDQYVTLRTDSSQIPGNLVNFPILVNSTNATLISKCQANGEDIRFVNDANTTEYPYEIEEWTPAGFTIWVNVTALSSAGQNINMYYNNPVAIDNQYPSNVWDTNYLAVYHMNSSDTHPNGCYDSTVYANHANYSGGLPDNTQSSGQNFDGGNDFIELPANVWLDCTDGNNLGTVTGYYQLFSPAADCMLWNQQKGAAYVISRARTSGKATTQGPTWSNASSSSISGGDWVVYTSSMYTDDTTLFLNGTIEGHSASCAMPTDDYDGTVVNRIGINSALGDDLRGNVSEFRISNIARSDNWVTTVHNNIHNYTTFISFGEEQSIPGSTDPIAGFTAVTMDLTNITLDWTRSFDGNFTHIEYNTIASWSRGDGTLIYNRSGVNHSEYNLTARTLYYFQAWAFNESTHNFSSATITNNHTGPGDVTNVVASVSDDYLSLSWDKNSRGGNTVVMRKADSYPSGVGDGTEIYNSTASSYNDNAFSTSMYYTIFAHNTTNHLSSLGNQVQWGVIEIRVYDENTSLPIYNYTVHVTNQSGSETYEEYSNGNQTTVIDISNMPSGENVVIRINASVYVNPLTTTEYEDRIYYYDIYPNIYYNISTYLLPSVFDCVKLQYTDSATVTDYNSDVVIAFTHALYEMISVEVYNKSLYTSYGGWLFVPDNNYTFSAYGVTIGKGVFDVNTTMVRVTYYYESCEKTADSYIVHVVDEGDYSVEGAEIKFKRYINASVGYENVGIYHTDANGYVTVALAPGETYLLEISKTGFNTSNPFMYPIKIIYIEDRYHTFKIYHTTLPLDVVTFNNVILFCSESGWDKTNNTLHISFFDKLSETSDITIHVYESYEANLTFNYSYSYTNTYDIDIWVTGLNTSRMHRIKIVSMNHTTLGCIVNKSCDIMPFRIDDDVVTEDELEDAFTDVGGDFSMGWVNMVILFVPSICILVGLGKFDPGFGVLVAGMYFILCSWQINLVDGIVIAAIIGMLIPLGVIVIISKRGKKIT